jgi:DNA-binding response OmpR family regulator
MRVLIVEDSKRIQTYVAKGLRQRGYAVDVASDGEEGLFLAESGEFDVIVLDLMLPKLDGLSLLRQLRERQCKTHVLILSARDTVEDRVKGLGDGADDYLVKPFAFDELLARIQALIRRSHGIKMSRLVFGDLEIDMAARVAVRAGAPLSLRPREYALLEYLALRKGELVPRAEIERHIYDERVGPLSNVVDSAVCSLRKIIDEDNRPSLIQTRRGMGYVFVGPEG